MKKIIAVLLTLSSILGLLGCSHKEKVWDWTQGLTQENIVCATPWNQDKINQDDAFAPLDDQETLELVTLLNKLTKDSFTENKHLRGGTATYGLEITLDSEIYHLNEANGPHGTLEVSYNEKLWWIDDAELSAFVQRVTTEDPAELEPIVMDTIPTLSVSYGEEVIDEPRIGVASWEYTNKDGTEGALLGDGAHPLDAKDSSPFFVLDPYAETPFEIWLIWELAPSTVMVRYWDESCWGQLEAQPVGRELLAKSGNADFAYYFEPQEGNYIYEVIATWDNAPDYSGRVYYNFHCVLTDEEPTAQMIYERAQRIYEKYLENFTKVDPLYMDLNQDGEPELIIDYRNSSEMAIVTIVDGEPVIAINGNCMFLCEDGIIGSWGEGSGGETVCYYRMEGQEVVLVDVVVSPANEFNWYHSSDPNIPIGSRKDMNRITKEEGQKICAQYRILDDSMPGVVANFYPDGE